MSLVRPVESFHIGDFKFNLIKEVSDKTAVFPIRIKSTDGKNAITSFIYQVELEGEHEIESVINFALLTDISQHGEIGEKISIYFSLFFDYVVRTINARMQNGMVFIAIEAFKKSEFNSYYIEKFPTRANPITVQTNQDNILNDMIENVYIRSYVNEDYMMTGYYKISIKLKSENIRSMLKLNKSPVNIDGALLPDSIRDTLMNDLLYKDTVGDIGTYLTLHLIRHFTDSILTLMFTNTKSAVEEDLIKYMYSVENAGNNIINIIVVPSIIYIERSMPARFSVYRDSTFKPHDRNNNLTHIDIELYRGVNNEEAINKVMTDRSLARFLFIGVCNESLRTDWINPLMQSSVVTAFETVCSPLIVHELTGFLSITSKTNAFDMTRFDYLYQDDEYPVYRFIMASDGYQLEKSYTDAVKRKWHYKKNRKLFNENSYCRIFYPVKRCLTHVVYKSIVKDPTTKKYKYIAIANTVYNGNNKGKANTLSLTEILMIKHSAYPHLQKIDICQITPNLSFLMEKD